MTSTYCIMSSRLLAAVMCQSVLMNAIRSSFQLQVSYNCTLFSATDEFHACMRSSYAYEESLANEILQGFELPHELRIQAA